MRLLIQFLLHFHRVDPSRTGPRRFLLFKFKHVYSHIRVEPCVFFLSSRVPPSSSWGAEGAGVASSPPPLPSYIIMFIEPVSLYPLTLNPSPFLYLPATSPSSLYPLQLSPTSPVLTCLLSSFLPYFFHLHPFHG